MSTIAVTTLVDSALQLHPRATESDPRKISEIEEVAHRVHAHIRFVLNGFAPINRRLPPEVLGIIPSFLVRDRDRIIATHVCRHWRNAFLSTPSLWNRISSSRRLEKTEAYLERSGDTLLDVSIFLYALWTRGGYASFQMLASLSDRWRTARFMKERLGMDILAVLQKPHPNLLELYLEVPDRTAFRGIEDLSGFPSLKSLTLIGDVRLLRFSRPFNLRKLGVSCDGPEFPLVSLLDLLAKIPLLEEFEAITPDAAPTLIEASPPTPVVLKHLQRLVFRGIRSDFPRILTPLIICPKDTKIVLTHSLSYDALRSPPPDPNHHMFPSGMQLPTASPPRFVRYRDIQDEDASESRFCIDLISVDGQHTLIENCYRWMDSSLQGDQPFESEEAHTECLGFLRTLDLSFVERFCVERCSPDPSVVGELMGGMTNLGTLVAVNGSPYGIFIGLEVRDPPVVRCPLLRRLVVRQDVRPYMRWNMLSAVVDSRAAHGSPLELVTISSAFNKLLEDPERSARLLEKTAKVTYDFGRSTFGWEWWEV